MYLVDWIFPENISNFVKTYFLILPTNMLLSPRKALQEKTLTRTYSFIHLVRRNLISIMASWYRKYVCIAGPLWWKSSDYRWIYRASPNLWYVTMTFTHGEIQLRTSFDLSGSWIETPAWTLRCDQNILFAIKDKYQMTKTTLFVTLFLYALDDIHIYDHNYINGLYSF